MTSELTSQFNKMATSEKCENYTFTKMEEELQRILDHEDSAQLCQEIIQGGILGPLVQVLKGGSDEDCAKAAQLVAQLAKIESCRIECVKHGIVPYLAEKLDSKSVLVALQACRALGNICFEHVYSPDEGRSSVIGCGGAAKLSGLLERALDLPESPENYQLQLVATGFLLNLFNTKVISQVHTADSHLIQILGRYLDKFPMDEDIPTHVILALSCLADADCSRGLVLAQDLSPQLVKILSSNNNNTEVIETCLEFITNLADDEKVKTMFARGDVCEAIVGVIEQHRHSPIPELSDHIIKTAAGLIVYILSGDHGPDICSGSKIFAKLLEWLACDVVDLKVQAALALGNLARTDENCMRMVKDGVAGKMVKVLSLNSTVDGEISLQHALLSALRNLCIAPVTKPLLIQEGALDVFLPMVERIETYPVVFKLLACLRMLIDNQTEAATKVGEMEAILKRLVNWSSVEDHPGVQGEASRLLAWLVKFRDHTKEFTKSFIQCGVLRPLIQMIGSEHPIMVNEAGFALNIILTHTASSDIIEELNSLGYLEKVVGALKAESKLPHVFHCLYVTMMEISKTGGGVSFLSTPELKAVLEICLNEKSLAGQTRELFDRLKFA